MFFCCSRNDADEPEGLDSLNQPPLIRQCHKRPHGAINRLDNPVPRFPKGRMDLNPATILEKSSLPKSVKLLLEKLTPLQVWEKHPELDFHEISEFYRLSQLRLALREAYQRLDAIRSH